MQRRLDLVGAVSVAYLVLGCAAGGGYAHSSAKMAMGGAASPQAASSVAVATGAPGAAPTTTQIPEQLVIEGSITLEVGEIGDVVPALRAYVDSLGGRVINESVSGAERSWSAQLKLRVPPERVQEVVTFLSKRGEITAKNITATDVSKQLFDQDLAIKNQRTTLDRLTKLMDSPGLAVQQILQIEQEMTRIRGQIDQLEGDQRFLKDRVGLATLDVAIGRREGAVTVAHAKAYPGARAAALILFDPSGRKRTRIGGGFVLHTVLRSMSLEVDMFEKSRDEAGTTSKNSAIATLGGATYSDFLGHGERQLLNPYMGLRIGYGYLDGHRFVLQGEAGVELFKAKYVIIDANVRATGLIGSNSDLALVAGAGATFAF